jgi:hypothetical protein
MKKLEELILDKLDDESLHILRENYPSLNIDLEWNRRLNNCDFEIWNSTLNFLLENKIKKTQLINSGLYNLRKCFSWKIGVIYDFRYGQVKSVEIRIGKNFGRYKFAGQNILFSWLDSDKNKKMLREIVSYNSKESLFSIKLSEDISEQVRDLILNNENLSVDVAIVNTLTRSFPGENPLGENFIAQAYSVSSNLKTIQLIPTINRAEIVRFDNIPINFSDEIKTYISTIKY